jgi:long-chain acyl-CoA synthetase
METIDQLLEESAHRYGPRLALKRRCGLSLEKVTYQGLWERAQRVTALLQQHGMQPGERVVLCAPNSPTWVVAYLGALLGGGVLVPLDIGSTPDFVAKVATQIEPVLALLSRSKNELTRSLSIPTLELETLPQLIHQEDRVHSRSLVSGRDLAEIMYTSGTTGEPKGVMLTHRNLTANVDMALQMMPLSPDAKILSLLPLSHMYEQIIGLLVPLRSGAAIVYLASRQPHVVLRTLRSEGVAAMALVPHALQLLMSNIEREAQRSGRARLWKSMNRLAPRLPLMARRLLFRTVHQELGGHLRFLASGGAAIDPELVQAWENLGVPVLQGYGTTEATAVVTGSGLHDRRIGTVGRVAPGQELTIAPDGEVLIRGENLSSGYWCNPQATQEAFQDGWYRTGDLGYLDQDGYLHFKGRKKDLIVLADGMNVYPRDIEDCLVRRPEIAAAVVVGLPQRGGRIEIHAAVLAADPAGVETAIRETNRLLAPHQQIRGFTIWHGDEFPCTHTLKVKRHEVLKALTQEDIGQESKPEVAETPGKMDLYDLVARTAGVPREQIGPLSTLGLDLGLDSLSVVELLCMVEEELGVFVEEARIRPEATVGDLVSILAEDTGISEQPVFPVWPRRTPARTARAVLQWMVISPLLAVLCPTQVTGLEHLENLPGPLLFSANHTSHLDTPILRKVLPAGYRRRLSVAAAADYWFANPLLGFSSSLLFNSYAMARRGAVRPSMEHTVDLVDAGWSVLIFPEGTRSPDGHMQPFKTGVGLLAVELGVPVVPIFLRGVYEVFPKGAWAPHRGPVEVTIGEPLRFPPRMDHAEAAKGIEQKIRELGGSSISAI